MPAKAWQEFAQQEDFVAAGYNDAILYGELVVITGGVVEKEFLDDWEMPEDIVICMLLKITCYQQHLNTKEQNMRRKSEKIMKQVKFRNADVI